MLAHNLSFQKQKLIYYFLIYLTCTLSAITIVPAQDAPKNPDRGAKVGNAYAIGDFEVINTTNGNLMLNFPLGALPAGRGDVGGGVSLVYNSKLWDIRTEKLEDFRGSPYPPFYDKTVIYPSTTGGWTMTPGVTSIEYEDRRDEYVPNWPSCPNGSGDDTGLRMTYVHKVRVVLPDGSKHEMVPTGYLDTPFVNDGFYRVRRDGWLENCGGAMTRTQQPVVYHSTDGSYLRLEYSYDSDADPNNNTWMLYMPDGKRFDGRKIYDRNGNWVAQSYTGVTDQFGRSVTISTAANGDTLVTSKGVGGEPVVWRVKWKTIGVHKTYASCEPRRCAEQADFRSGLDANLRVVDRVIQPLQMGSGEYVFSYNAEGSTGPLSFGWGELSSIRLPSGARVNYSFVMDGQDGPAEFFRTAEILKNYPRTKQLNYNLEYDGMSSPTSETWTYDIQNGISTVTGPDGGITIDRFGVTDGGSSQLPWDSGLSLSTTSPDGTTTEKLWAKNLPTDCGGAPCLERLAINPYVDAELTSIRDAAGNYTLTALKDYVYDKNGNVIEVREYDWMPYSMFQRSGGVITSIPTEVSDYLRRITTTEFYNATPEASSSDYADPDSYHVSSSPRLLRLPKNTEVLDASRSPQSRSEMTYDYTSYGGNPIGGNLRETRSWDSFKGGVPRGYSNPLSSTNSTSTSATYNSFGMAVSTTDANGVITRIIYDPISTPSGSIADLYPTRTVSASGTNVARSSSAAYDFFSGLSLSTTDDDNHVTNATEYDALGRPTREIAAVGTPVESWTRTTYNDTGRYFVVSSDLENVGDGKKVVTQFLDQIGRVRLSKTLEDATTQSATNETDGIKVQTRYAIVDSGASGYGTQLTSNPYRTAYSWQASSDPMMGWTRSKAWRSGRKEAETFSGASLPSPWETNSNSTGVTTTEIDSNTTTVTDQAGKKRRSVSDGLGRLMRVDEPNAAGELGTVASPNQPTYYFYDPLGHMVRVQQGVQNRHFMYDSLGRLTRVRQPEQNVNNSLNTSGNPSNNSWSAGFSYDNNGNLLASRDSRNVVITTAYDPLNRPLVRTYSDSTPVVTYTYDAAGVPFSKGKLTKISSTVSEMRYLVYDEKGRLKTSEQVTDGRAFGSAYRYNLAGALIEQTYPSGRVVKNFLETDGDIGSIASKLSNGPFKNYAASFSYTASGAIKHLQLGNGLWESAQLNSRNQVTELNLGNSPTDGSLWKLSYSYGELDPNGNVDAARNTGNIARQMIRVPAVQDPFVQAYRYDSLDRIAEAKETIGSAQTWTQAFGYDRYGNRISFAQNVGGQQLQLNNLTLPAVDPNTNRFQTGQGYGYDAVGNLESDPQGRRFTFNAANQQTQVLNEQAQVVGEYRYDGSGKRLKKITATETTVFVYDGLGKLVAELSTASATSSPTVNYTATDPLGSPRVLTNSRGQVVSRRDFMPFGEELAADPAYRTANVKYGLGDNVRKKFTGYERDEETGLDFAEARYYNNVHGRFTAVDPLLASGKSADPQTFNRYVYVMNRPLVFTDPSGGCPEDKPVTTEPCEIQATVAPQSSTVNAQLVAGDTVIHPNILVTLSQDLQNALTQVGQDVERTQAAFDQDRQAALVYASASLNHIDGLEWSSEVRALGLAVASAPALLPLTATDPISAFSETNPNEISHAYVDGLGMMNLPSTIANGSLSVSGGLHGASLSLSAGGPSYGASSVAIALQENSNTLKATLNQIASDDASHEFARSHTSAQVSYQVNSGTGPTGPVRQTTLTYYALYDLHRNRVNDGKAAAARR